VASLGTFNNCQNCLLRNPSHILISLEAKLSLHMTQLSSLWTDR